MSRIPRRLAAALALAAAFAGGSACSPSTPMPTDQPSPRPPLPDAVELAPAWTGWPAWEPVASRVLAGPAPLEGGLRPDTVLVTNALPLPVSFWVREWRDQRAEFCDPHIDSNTVRLGWIMGCVSAVDIIVPDNVACVGAPRQPAATDLAGAILANDGLGAMDLGPVEGSPILPPRLFRAEMTGRVVVVPGRARRFQPVNDPDSCVLARGDEAIEVRGDLDALLILLDVNGRLAIVRAAAGGSDAASGAGAVGRGYGVSPSERAGAVGLYRSMLWSIRDIAFSPSP